MGSGEKLSRRIISLAKFTKDLLNLNNLLSQLLQ